ncbi:MAG: ATP-binding protein [Acidobacteria bacterium]|nr:ATP-binding protein [Acidobacteriota bacterium]
MSSPASRIPLPEVESAESFFPPVPQTIEETGLGDTFLQQLILKIIYFRGEILGHDLAKCLGLNFSLIESTLEFFKLQHLLVVKRSLGMGFVSSVFALPDQGRAMVAKHLEANTYAGKAPVPLAQYAEAVGRQKRKGNWLTMGRLLAAFQHMVINPSVLAQIGPAVNSGKSFLIYGQPGNGKTYIAEALLRLETDPIFIPYAIECQGQIIQMFDPTYHQRLDAEDDHEHSIWTISEDEKQYDGRWFLARRPFVVSGGELTLEMLDLAYKPDSKIYDAPFQLKANNGIYLIDDFGRQQVSPSEVLNRWVVPMERGLDYFNFLSGGKMSVPFETFLVFSTNLRPDQIGDEAFLRRIQYKLFLRSPGEEEFIQIFRLYCASEDLPIAHGALPAFIEKHYRATGKMFRRCHPRDVITHAIDLIHFERRPWELTEEVLDKAFECTFITDTYES